MHLLDKNKIQFETYVLNVVHLSIAMEADFEKRDLLCILVCAANDMFTWEMVKCTVVS